MPSFPSQSLQYSTHLALPVTIFPVDGGQLLRRHLEDFSASSASSGSAADFVTPSAEPSSDVAYYFLVYPYSPVSHDGLILFFSWTPLDWALPWYSHRHWDRSGILASQFTGLVPSLPPTL
jgi:hypothetical protein